jgi:hypothetical protein
MMHRTGWLLLLALFCSVHSNAQRHDKKMGYDSCKLVLRMSPLGLLDPVDYNLSFGAEYRYTENRAFTLDAGWIYFTNYEVNCSTTGILLRPGIRQYFGKRKELFVEGQLHYKNVTYDIEDWLGKQPVNGVAAYEEYKHFKYKKQTMGVQCMVGICDRFISRRLLIEAYIGVGIRYKKEGLYHEPNSIFERTGFISGFNNNLFPVLPGGLRLIYHLR